MQRNTWRAWTRAGGFERLSLTGFDKLSLTVGLRGRKVRNLIYGVPSTGFSDAP